MTNINNQDTSNHVDVRVDLEKQKEPKEYKVKDTFADLKQSLGEYSDLVINTQTFFNQVNDFTTFQEIIGNDVIADPAFANLSDEQKKVIQNVIDVISESVQGTLKEKQEQIATLGKMIDGIVDKSNGAISNLYESEKEYTDYLKECYHKSEIDDKVESMIAEMYNTLEKQQSELLENIATQWVENNKVHLMENANSAIEKQFTNEMFGLFAKYSNLFEGDVPTDKDDKDDEKDDKLDEGCTIDDVLDVPPVKQETAEPKRKVIAKTIAEQVQKMESLKESAEPTKEFDIATFLRSLNG